jgi:hypothetical protein
MELKSAISKGQTTLLPDRKAPDSRVPDIIAPITLKSIQHLIRFSGAKTGREDVRSSL